MRKSVIFVYMKYVYTVKREHGTEVWNQLSKLCKVNKWSYEYVRRKGSKEGYPIIYKGVEINKQKLL